MTRETTVRIVDWSLELDPAWPPELLVCLLALAALVALWVYGSRSVDLGPRTRIFLGLLRALALMAPIAVLARPHLDLRLERSTPRTILFLVDGSGSMSVSDGPEAAPAARWDRAIEAVRSSLPGLEAAKTEIAVFDEEIRPLAPGELASPALRPTGRRTALGAALEKARSRLAGTPAASVILASDGADTASSPELEPLKVARGLARAGIPVHACLTGSEHPRDVAVRAWADSMYAASGDPVPIRVRLEQNGFGGSAVTVSVSREGRTVATREVSLPSEDTSVELVLDAALEGSGRTTCRVEASLLSGELTPWNNAAAVEIVLVDQPLRVLYVEKLPRWQFRFLANAMRRDDKLDPTLVLLTEDAATPAAERTTVVVPSSPEDVARFDAIAIGDVGPQDLPPELWQAIEDHVVKAGAGLILIAGTEHNPRDLAAVLGSLLPFERAVAAAEGEGAGFRPRPTPLGLLHPLTRLGAAAGEDPRKAWEELPAIEWVCPVSDVKPGALVLAEVPAAAGGASQPLVMLQRVGRGTVVFVGTDETWKWRYQVGNKRFYGFWGQVLRHAAMSHRALEREPVRILLPPGKVAAGSPIQVTVAVEGQPAAGSATKAEGPIVLIAERLAPPGGAEAPAGAPAAPPLRFALERAEDAFAWQGRIWFLAGGSYRLTVEGIEGAGERTVDVSQPSAAEAELADPSVRPALLREIAALTGGEYGGIADLAALASKLDLSPLRERWSERRTLWDGWPLLAALAVLLTIEWVVRKWRYLP